MDGLKQQLERIRSYDEELGEIAEKAGYDEKASDNDLGEFLEWTRETENPYCFVREELNTARMHLWNSVGNITGNLAMVDYLTKGEYDRAEREIEAAYQLADQDLKEVLN